MSFSVVTNLASLNAQATLNNTSVGLQKTLARLTSGLRINSSQDDAAGLAIANRHKLDNTSLTMGVRSANDAISKLQIEDGALNSISLLLDRAIVLASQAASDTFTGSRDTLDTEFQTVIAEITRNALAAGLETGNVNLNARSIFVGNTQTNTSAAVSYVSFAFDDRRGLGRSWHQHAEHHEPSQRRRGHHGRPGRRRDTGYSPGSSRCCDEPLEFCHLAGPGGVGCRAGFGIPDP